jgi:exodeoxyribonuclease VII large subunit
VSRRAGAAASADAARVFTVGELTEWIAGTLAALPPVWVAGEIATLRVPASGHCYFTLRDESATLACVLWRGQRRAVPFDLAEGLAVVCLGEVSVYPTRGVYQLVVSAVEPRGVGAEELALRQRIARLTAEGLLAPERKRPLPEWPRAVGLVTSRHGAAVADLRRVLGRRWPGAAVVLAPVRVQGEAAPFEIVQALDALGQWPGIDVVIVGRGGGAREDLAAWNDEAVARAIAACPRPVVSAVGHEIDVTLADLVADVRAATPSEAAELVVPDRVEVGEQVDDLAGRLHRAARGALDDAAAHLAGLAAHWALRDPVARVRQLQQRCDDLADRLGVALRSGVRGAAQRVGEAGRRGGAALRQALAASRERVATGAARLDALSPLAVLGRGYSVTQAQGRALLDPADAPAGTPLAIRLHRGRLRARSEGREA